MPFVKLSAGLVGPKLSKVHISVSLVSNATDKKYMKKSKAILKHLVGGGEGSKENRIILIHGHSWMLCLEEIM